MKTLIHKNDKMLWRDNVKEYWEWANSALSIIQKYEITKFNHILDYGSGYGRVTRMFQKKYPDSEVIAYDINSEAMDFCEKTLGLKVVRKEDDIKRNYFDLIFCGSVLTHMDTPMWKHTLELLHNTLKKSGSLVFTTNGDNIYNMKALPAMSAIVNRETFRESYRDNGFAYSPYKSNENYGLSYSNQKWTTDFIKEYTSFQIREYLAEGWNNRQDVYILIKK